MKIYKIEISDRKGKFVSRDPMIIISPVLKELFEESEIGEIIRIRTNCNEITINVIDKK